MSKQTSEIGKRVRIISSSYEWEAVGCVGTIFSNLPEKNGARIEHESFPVNDAANGRRAWFFDAHEFEQID